MSGEMVVIDEALLRDGATWTSGQASAGWNSHQLRLIGAWPPVKGWKNRVLGSMIPRETAAQFVALRGLTPAERRTVQRQHTGSR